MKKKFKKYNEIIDSYINGQFTQMLHQVNDMGIEDFLDMQEEDETLDCSIQLKMNLMLLRRLVK